MITIGSFIVINKKIPASELTGAGILQLELFI